MIDENKNKICTIVASGGLIHHSRTFQVSARMIYDVEATLWWHVLLMIARQFFSIGRNFHMMRARIFRVGDHVVYVFGWKTQSNLWMTMSPSSFPPTDPFLRFHFSWITRVVNVALKGPKSRWLKSFSLM